MKTLHYKPYTSIPFFNHQIFFSFHGSSTLHPNPKLDKYCSVHFQVFLSVSTGIFTVAKKYKCNQSLHTKRWISSDTLNISKHSRILMTGAISAPPTSLSFRHWGVNSSDFTLGKFVDLEIFAQNLLTELFYFRKAWSRQKGQGQYVQSMYFFRGFLNKNRKMLFLFFC